MPQGSQVNIADLPVKVLVVGDSGDGKTGAIFSLVKAGYNVRCLDYDNGFRIVVNLARRQCPEMLPNIHYEPLTDTFKNLNGRLVPKKATAWSRGTQLLSNWKVGAEGEPGYYNLGPITDWTSKDVLVIDSLTHMGEAVGRYHQSLNGKLGEKLSLRDWGFVQSYIRDLLALLYDDSIKCNVVVNTHIDKRYAEKRGLDAQGNATGPVIERELVEAFPNAPGRALPEEVGSYFNDALQVIAKGSGASQKKFLMTVPPHVLKVKTSNPGAVKKEYPIETGLADFFKDVKG